QPGHRLVVGTVLGVGALELGVGGGRLAHALGGLFRVRTGGAGFLLFLLVLGVLVGFAVVGGLLHGLLFFFLFLLFFRGRGHLLFDVVVEAGDDLGQALLALLVQRVVLHQLLDRPREGGQRGQHLVQAFLYPHGDL